MTDILKYKSYIGSIEYSDPDKVFHGKVLGVDALISYEGENKEELEEDFRGAVDDYLELCEDHNIPPETSFGGRMYISISPEIQQKAAEFALNRGITLDVYIESLLSAALAVNQ